MNQKHQIKNIVVLAHPDDETLGCYSVMNKNTFCLIVCDEDSRFELTKKLYPDVKFKCLNFKPGQIKIDPFELNDIIYKNVEKYITPDTMVFTHHPEDLHLDHKIVTNAVQVVFRPERIDFKGLLYCYITNNDNFKPNYFIKYNYYYKEKNLKEYIQDKKLKSIVAELNLEYNNLLKKKYSLNSKQICYEPFEINFLKYD